MDEIMAKCAICGKTFPMNTLKMPRIAELDIRAAAEETLANGSTPKLMDDLACCTRRGITVTSLFCPDCLKIIEQEIKEELKQKDN